MWEQGLEFCLYFVQRLGQNMFMRYTFFFFFLFFECDETLIGRLDFVEYKSFSLFLGWVLAYGWHGKRNSWSKWIFKW